MTIQVYPNQAFRVKFPPVLAPLQIQTLTQFYQPIMGPMAVGLYLTLSNLIPESLNWSYRQQHSQLMALMNIGIAEINQARLNLEGLGLMKTYRDEASHKSYQRQTLVYDLRPPLSVRQFVNHSQFNISLFHQLGDESYYQLIDLWSEEKLNDLEKSLIDISQPFSEVFNAYNQTTHQEEIADKVEGKKYQEQYNEDIALVQADSIKFDYDLFQQVLSTEGFDLASISNVVKQEVLALSQFYELDEVAMARVAKLAQNEKNLQINIPDLRTIARKQEYFAKRLTPAQLKQAQRSQTELESPAAVKERKLETKEAYPYFSEAQLEIIDICERLSPSKMLVDLKRHIGGFASDSEQQTINRLQQQSSLNDPVINMLIYYIIKMRKNTTVNQKFADIIANEWQQEGLSSPAQVMDFVVKKRDLRLKQQAVREKQANLNKSKPFNKYRQKNKRQESIPSWMKMESENNNTPTPILNTELEDEETRKNTADSSELKQVNESDSSLDSKVISSDSITGTGSAELAANEARLRKRLKQLLEDKEDDHG